MNAKKTSLEHMLNVGINFFRRYFTKNRCFESLLTSLYVTLRCNLKCSYCYYHKREYPELDTEKMLVLLEKIRPQNPALNITGGEPLIRNDIIKILQHAKKLKFAPIVLNTNGLVLHLKEDVLNYVDYVIISLDSVNTEEWDGIINAKGASRIIIDNIIKYSKLQSKFGFYLTINSVITKDNIESFYSVLEFCKKYNLPISPVPQDNGTRPIPELINSDKYKKLIKDIIKMKKNGYPIVASDKFLKSILNFPKHNCFPSLVPRVFPDGQVYYPCQPLQKQYGSLIDYPNLRTLIREAYKKNGLPECSINGNRCYMSCYLEFVNVIENPLLVANEHIKNIK